MSAVWCVTCNVSTMILRKAHDDRATNATNASNASASLVASGAETTAIAGTVSTWAPPSEKRAWRVSRERNTRPS